MVQTKFKIFKFTCLSSLLMNGAYIEISVLFIRGFPDCKNLKIGCAAIHITRIVLCMD